MKILVLGSGAREHAIILALRSEEVAHEIFAAPGNAGIAQDATLVALDADDPAAVTNFSNENDIDLVVIGPEAPLVAGVADALRTRGIPVFGPGRAAAQLEGSKAFAKRIMDAAGVPTGRAVRAATRAELETALDELGSPFVVKADGLAAGKGVIVAMTLADAEAAITDMLAGDAFGAAGARVVIEEFLDGEEASFISMVDGTTALPMATSQDHKRVGDGDTGPNTGGMGAYSPAPVVTSEVHARVMRDVVEPTVRGMASDGIPFTGFLYAGLMIDKSGAPKVIEFNVRFGDPETQPVMLRLQSDLLDLVDAAIDGRLDSMQAQWDPRPSLGVVMAAEHYPATPRLGDAISGWDVPDVEGTKVFHAGTKLEGSHVVTSGGRVLCVCALGESVADAQRKAHAEVAGISWHGEFHRHDIGWRAIEREQRGA